MKVLGITWVIDKDGKLTVTGKGEFGNGWAPWLNFSNSILSAEVAIKDITDLSSMFAGCEKLASIDMDGLDTSQVTDMSNMFDGCHSLKSIDISNFDTSNVISMAYMFHDCQNLTNVDVSSFNTSNVINMVYMFWNCQNLTSVDVSGFDTSQVTNMACMFARCHSMISIDVSGFNTSQVTDMAVMFDGCNNLEKIDVSGFDTSKVTDMDRMFSFCNNLTSIDVSGFDTSKVTDMTHMFSGCNSLESLDISNFDISNVENGNTGAMFRDCTNLNTIKTPKNVLVEIALPDSDGYSWYYNETEITSLPQNLSYSVEIKRIEKPTSPDNIASGKYGNITWVIDTNGKLTVTGSGEFSSEMSGVERAPWYGNRGTITSAEVFVEGITNLKWMFFECENLTSVNLNGLDTKNVTDMSGMFSRCGKLTSVDVSGFHTANVKDMGAMFFNCVSLTSVDVSGFHTENVTSMANMFSGCISLTSVDVSSFHTANVKDVNFMFLNCIHLTSLNLSSFDFSNVADTPQNMFEGCSHLMTIQTPKNVAVEIALPESGWHYDNAEITSLPRNLSYSVVVTKNEGAEPAAPVITTTEISNAVQNVPYEAVIQNNGWNAISYRISSGGLPAGIDLGVDGVIYGVTKETGKFNFTVTMTVNNVPSAAEMTYTLEVLKSTDSNVDAIDEPGYEIIQPVEDINIKQGITDQLFISNGPYEEFRNVYIDGDRLIQDVDYTAESGSTRITIKAETLGKLGTGKHTLGVEFRNSEGTLKRIAQNFKISNGKSGSGKGSSNKNDGLNNGNQESFAWTDSFSEMADFILWEIPHPEQIDEYGYYPVDIAFASEKNAVITPKLLGKYYGQQAYLMTHLGNGIGYSISTTDINPELMEFDLSAVLEPLDGFADDFATLHVRSLNEALLPCRIGLHVHVGTKHSGKAAYLFRYDKALGDYVPIGAALVSENGNVMMFMEEMTDVIIMIEQ